MVQSHIQPKEQGNKNSIGDGERERGRWGIRKKLKKGGVNNIGGLHKKGGKEPSNKYIAAKLANANKTKEFITSQKLGSGDL